MYYRRRNNWLSLRLTITSAIVACIGLLLIAIPQLVRSVVVVATYPIVHVRNIAVTSVQPFFSTGQAERDATIAALKAELAAQREQNSENDRRDSAVVSVDVTTGSSTATSTASTSESIGADLTVATDVVDDTPKPNPNDENFVRLGEAVFAPPYSVTDRLVLRLANTQREERFTQDLIGARAYVRVGGLYIPVGSIESADAVTAAVTLYSLPDRPVLVRFATSTTIHTLNGYGGGIISGQLPKALTVAVGERVLLAQDGPAVFFGVVRFVERDDSNPLDRVFISLPLAPASLQDIYVERT